jgi:hypothetical protein
MLRHVTSENEALSLPNEDEKFLKQMVFLTQEKYRQYLWGGLKKQRLSQDPEKAQSDTISTEEDIINLKKQTDKVILNSIRIAALNRNTSLIIEYCKLI